MIYGCMYAFINVEPNLTSCKICSPHPNGQEMVRCLHWNISCSRSVDVVSPCVPQPSAHVRGCSWHSVVSCNANFSFGPMIAPHFLLYYYSALLRYDCQNSKYIYTYIHTYVRTYILLLLPFARLYTLKNLVFFNISSFESSPTSKLTVHDSLRTLSV